MIVSQFILEIAEALGGELPSDALAALKAEKLTAADAPLALTTTGADELGMRLARLLTHPSLARAADSGREPLPAAAEAEARAALLAVARSRLAATPMPEVFADDSESDALLGAFVAEKRRVLEASVAALSR